MPKLTTTAASRRRLAPQLSLVELAGPELNSGPGLTLPQRAAALTQSVAPLTTSPRSEAVVLSSAPLAPEQIAPLITSEQLQLVSSGLEALSQPLLKYLDPEEHYQVVRHTSVDQDYQHLTLALKSSTPDSDLSPCPSAVTRSTRAPSRSDSSARERTSVSPNEDGGLVRTDLLLTAADAPALVLPQAQPQTCCSFFSGTPKAADLQTWRNPAYQALTQNTLLPEGKLTISTPQGLMRLDPDCNLLLDVYGLLFQHTGFCTLPIFTSDEQERAQPYYECLNQAAQRYRELFALFYYSVGGVSLEQSRTQLYRELYTSHDHPSSLGQALSERSAERAFLEQKRALQQKENLVGAGVPQLLIGQYQDRIRPQHQASSALPTPQSAPELVGTPHHWWNQERSLRSHYLPAKTPDHDLTLDYLCAGFERLCLNKAPEQVQNLVATYQPWEVVVDASNLGADAALVARTKLQSQRLHSHDPRRVTLRPPERKLTELAEIEQLRHPPVPQQLSSELAGGCYWGHEVKLYALPSIMEPAPEDATTALSLLKAWESERVAAYWQQLEQLCTCPDASYYPPLFSHDGIPWYRATQNLLTTPSHSYDGSEQSRRTLTGHLARAYSLEQSLTYCAGHERKLAAILAAPHSILRAYLSEAARSESTPLLKEEQLFLGSTDRRPIPDYETLQIKLLAQSGLSHELCAYYCITTRRKLNQLVAKSSPDSQPSKDQSSQDQPLKIQQPKAHSSKAQQPQAQQPKTQPLKAQSSKVQPQAQQFKAPSINDLLNQAATALYLKALVRHYYSELRRQGLLYQEHIRLPLTPLDPRRHHQEISNAVLRLVLTATSARPDLHFCGARLGQPFALSARPQRLNRAEHLEHRLSLAHFDPDPSGRRTRGRRVLSADLRLHPQPVTTPCEHDELEPLYCDLSLYFTKPSTELERAQHLTPQLKRSAQALERTSPAQFYSRSFALQGQRSNLEQALPLWTREQIRTTKVNQELSHPLTFAQHYVLTQLQHGRSFGPNHQTQYQVLSCPELNACCANRNGSYQGQINFFLAAAVYQGARELSHLAELPEVSAQDLAPKQEKADSAHFPSFGLFLYTLEALENQEALAVQCQCGHSSIVFNPKLDLHDSEHEQLCPHCPNNLLL